MVFCLSRDIVDRYLSEQLSQKRVGLTCLRNMQKGVLVADKHKNVFCTSIRENVKLVQISISRLLCNTVVLQIQNRWDPDLRVQYNYYFTTEKQIVSSYITISF